MVLVSFTPNFAVQIFPGQYVLPRYYKSVLSASLKMILSTFKESKYPVMFMLKTIMML
jgi:hypothetical protein